MSELLLSEPFSAVDTAWLRMDDSTNLMMVSGVFLFDEVVGFEEFTALVRDRLLRHPRFRERVHPSSFPLALPRWEEDPHFDVRAHVHRVALPSPGNDRALRDLVGDLISTPFDFSKPLWQFHVVERYGRGSAVIARLHHAMADGVALVKVILSMADGAPAPAGPPAPEIAPHSWLQEGLDTLQHPGRLLDAAARAADGADALARLLLMSEEPATPLKGPLGVAKRVAWSRPFPLADVKEVGRLSGGTLNDAVLAAAAGALRRYLVAHGRDVSELELRAVVPVNLRPPDDTSASGNKFGLIFLPLPVGIEHPVDRLLELRDRMDAIKASPEALVAYGLLGAIGVAPAEVERAVVDLFGRRATAVMTNVPGPRLPLTLAGKKIKSLMFWVPQSGRLGLGLSVLSYAGSLSVGVATDAGLVPDPEEIVAGFSEELKDLIRIARVEKKASLPAKKPARRRRRS